MVVSNSICLHIRRRNKNSVFILDRKTENINLLIYIEDVPIHLNLAKASDDTRHLDSKHNLYHKHLRKDLKNSTHKKLEEVANIECNSWLVMVVYYHLMHLMLACFPNSRKK